MLDLAAGITYDIYTIVARRYHVLYLRLEKGTGSR